jgi:hypothetical protein
MARYLFTIPEAQIHIQENCWLNFPHPQAVHFFVSPSKALIINSNWIWTLGLSFDSFNFPFAPFSFSQKNFSLLWKSFYYFPDSFWW